MEEIKDKIVLEWMYKPENYVEEPCQIQGVDYVIDIGNGKAKVILDSKHENYDSRRIITKQILSDIAIVLSSIEVITHKPYKLYKSLEVKCNSDGTRDLIISSLHIVSRASVSLDVLIKQNGVVIHDSRQERLDEMRKFIELNRKHIADPTLKAIMQSHHTAFNDPDNEFLHLYEIRDALINRFSSKKNALKKLKISDSEWGKLGDLANTENHPVKQSRHRGKFVGELREATMEELTEARRIAAAMIKSYLDYLEEQANVEISLQP
jgi:hypothetical protein